MGKHGVPIGDRIIERTRKDPDGCWRWTGAVHHSGYGSIGTGNHIVRSVHVVAYELFVGPVPDGMDVGHKCHDAAARAGLCAGGQDCVHRVCVRPHHLQPEPRGTNLSASPLTQASLNQVKTSCKRGHEFTPENTYHKKRTGWRSCRTCNSMTKEERQEWDRSHD